MSTSTTRLASSTRGSHTVAVAAAPAGSADVDRGAAVTALRVRPGRDGPETGRAGSVAPAEEPPGEQGRDTGPGSHDEPGARARVCAYERRAQAVAERSRGEQADDVRSAARQLAACDD